MTGAACRPWTALVICVAAGACATGGAWRAVSPDHGTRVTVVGRGGQSCITIGAGPAQCHDGVDLAIAFASRGPSVAYGARVGDRWTVFHDGRAGSSWDGVGPPVLSADGARVAYAASAGGRWRVVVDEMPGEPFDAIVRGTLTFDPSGSRVAYAARRGDSVYVVTDGAVSRGWTRATRPLFDDNGAHVAYGATLGALAMVVLDGSAGPAHEAIGEIALSASPEGWAYGAYDHGAWYVIGPGAVLGPYESIRDLRFGRRGGAVPSFIARGAGRESAVVGGVSRGSHGHVSSLALDRTGERWGYIADDSAVYVDGTLTAIEKQASELAIAEDGARFAYLARRGDTIEVVDDRGRSRFDLVVEGTLQFLPSTHVWTCLAGDRARRELFVVVNGQRTERRLDWTEVVRFASQPNAQAAVKAWVAAEARLATTAGSAR